MTPRPLGSEQIPTHYQVALRIPRRECMPSFGHRKTVAAIPKGRILGVIGPAT